MRDQSNTRLVVQRLRRFFGHFPQVDSSLDRLRELVARPCGDEEPEHLMLVGDSGTGKSTLLKWFVNQHPRLEHVEVTEVPVLYAEVPSNCTIKKLAGVMLQALESPHWNKGSEEERTYQLKTLLATCRVRVVVLDEINHVVDRGRTRSHSTVADWIKQQATQTGVSFVLAGVSRSRRLLESNDQFADRFRELIELRPLGVGSDSDRQEFVRVIESFEDILQDLCGVRLTDERVLGMLAFSTGGRLRDIRRLLVRAVELVGKSPTQRIDRAVLSRAFEQVIFSKALPQQNPFDARFRGTPLIRAGEPFAPTGD